MSNHGGSFRVKWKSRPLFKVKSFGGYVVVGGFKFFSSGHFFSLGNPLWSNLGIRGKMISFFKTLLLIC